MKKKLSSSEIRDFLSPAPRPKFMFESSIEVDIDLECVDIKDLYIKFIGSLRAMHIWYHSAHVLSKGTGYAGDHVLLYGKIYNEITEQLDEAQEKVLGQTNDESLICPKTLTKVAAIAIQMFDSPSDSSSYNIAETALHVEKLFLTALEVLYHAIKAQDMMTLGLEDYIAGLANTHEGYVYLLQQRTKTRGD